MELERIGVGFAVKSNRAKLYFESVMTICSDLSPSGRRWVMCTGVFRERYIIALLGVREAICTMHLKEGR
jgi:hypothetical protein